MKTLLIGMAVVTQCPTDAVEKFFASLRLGCGSDIYGNDQYICAPNEAKTSLVELCNEGIMGIIDKGYCLVVDGTRYRTKSCRDFYTGCPTEHYWSSNFYNNSACQKIDTQRQCYVMDRFCQNQMSDEDRENAILINLAWCLTAVFVIVVLIYLYIFRKSRKLTKEPKNPTRTYGKTDIDTEELDSCELMSDTGDNLVTEEHKPVDFRSKEDHSKGGNLASLEKKPVDVHSSGDQSKGESLECAIHIPANVQQKEDHIKVNKASRKKQYEEVRLVIIGKTGSGKSSTGNTILGKRVFESTISGSSITRDCSQHFVERFDRKIVIVDTPGIFDTKENNEKIQEEIYKCVGITSPGPHAFIFVISAGSRYTEEEQRSVEHFVNYFGNEIFKYLIILFVRKDELDDHNIQLSDHIRNAPSIMKQFIQKCGGRVCAFNNKATGGEQDEQVKQLLKQISENIKKNGGNCYTNELYKVAEMQIKIKEEKRLAKENAEKEKQLQSIKQAIFDNYNKKLEQNRKVLESLQKNIDELLTKQSKDSNRIADLQSQIGPYEEMVEEKRDQKDLDFMHDELTKSREASTENALLVEQYKKDIDKSQEEKKRLKREYEIEIKKLQLDQEIKIAAGMEKMRNEIRQNMDKEFKEFKTASSKDAPCTIL